MNYKATKHFWQRAQERGLLKRHAEIAKTVEHGRKIPQRNNTGAVIANTFAHIGEQITVISHVTGNTTNLITIYETR